MNDLHCPFAAPPAIGATREVAPGLQWLRMPLPFALDHVNLWLIEEGEAWAAVDAGIALDPVKAAWREILAQRRLARLIVTHYHPDHLGLAAWLGAPLWIAPAEYHAARATIEQSEGHTVSGMLDFFARHGLDAARLALLAELGHAYARGVPALPEAFTPLSEGEVLRLGAHEWRIILGHGHSPAHACLYSEALGILIAGDMLLPRISTNVSLLYGENGDPLGQFLASLERLAMLPADTLVLPSHGLPFYGLHARIRQLQAHHDARCAALVAACAKAPATAAELLPVLFQREIADPHQLRFAMGEAIAHLVHLERRGAIERRIEGSLVRFAA
ncbi:MAG: MBL fold metallo-hydrolase [Rhodocyclaceae bacterium]|nr:MBL fold metallo-hydrolase [Rhodocyclaceae bacterium]